MTQKMITAEDIKELRAKTGAGVMACRNALTETEGDREKAIQILRRQGLAIAEKKASREASQGLIEAYVHFGGRIAALVEVNCETDFVARTPEFKELAHNLAMQVAASSPRFIAAEDIPTGTDLDPKEVCLLSQPFIKDPTRTPQDLLMDVIAKVGENVKVRKFTRFELGE